MSKIYYITHNNTVIGISNEKIEDYTENIDTDNYSEALATFETLGLSLDVEATENLQEVLDDENSDDDQKVEEFKIKHWVSNRSFGELVDMYHEGEIKVPKMQRKFVWTSTRSSRLIESIILGLPIPPLFLLEVNDNEYEIIDGFQRLTALYNYMYGFPWTGLKDNTRNVQSKLSRKGLSVDIQGKAFNELSKEHQLKLRRSTIPLVEFKQLNPGDFSSKYLIFERINTGSEKLNGMQIRKSLAYGSFMEGLYEYANSNIKFSGIFTPNQIKKDIHVEALLRIIAISDVNFERFKPSKYGIKNILDEYCEKNKDKTITETYIQKIFNHIETLILIFGEKHVFRKINSNGKFEGNLNMGILESLLGTLLEQNRTVPEDFKDIYIDEMQKREDSYVLGEDINPFSASTGSKKSIIDRYLIFSNILGD